MNCCVILSFRIARFLIDHTRQVYIARANAYLYRVMQERNMCDYDLACGINRDIVLGL